MSTPDLDTVFGPSYNMSMYLNYDISTSSSLFAGVRIRALKDKDGISSNSVNKSSDGVLQDVSYGNEVDEKSFKLTTFEIGLRFS